MDLRSLLKFLTSSSVSQLTQKTIDNGQLVSQAQACLNSLGSALMDSNSSAKILLRLSEDNPEFTSCVVNIQEVLGAYANGIPLVEIYPLDPVTGELMNSTEFDTAELYESLQRELNMSVLTTELIPLLTEISDSTSLPAYVDILKTKVEDVGGPVRDSAMALLNQASIRASSPVELADIMMSLFTDVDTNDAFMYTSAGKATNTTGWGLYFDFNVDFSSIQAFLQSVKDTIVDKASTWYESYLHNYHRQVELNAQVVAGQLYAISNIWQDEYIRRLAEFDDVSFTNGFRILGGASDALITAFHKWGGSPATAIAIPTMGATWYIFNDPADNGRIKIGYARHLYDSSSADLCYSACAATGNDWDDILELPSPIKPLPAFSDVGYTSVNSYNDYLVGCLQASAKLVPYGLLAVSSRSIVNRYAQDPDAYIRDNFISTWFPSITIDSRASFISQAQVIGNASSQGSILTFVNSCLAEYFSNLEGSSLIGVPYQHKLVTKTLRGLFQLQDDAITVDQIATTVKATLATVAAVAVVAAAVAGFAKFKAFARTFNVEAQRAMFDADVSPADAAKLVRRANFYNMIAGITVGSSTDVASAAIGEVFSAANEGFDSTTTTLESLRRLIKPD